MLKRRKLTVVQMALLKRRKLTVVQLAVLKRRKLTVCSIVKELSKNVDQSHQFFIVTRREAPLQRVLTIWRREVSRNPSSVNGTLRVNFMGERGIDSEALSREFLTDTITDIGSGTFHIQNGTIDEAHMEEIVNSVIITIVTKRVVFLKEFMEGLKLFGVAEAIRRYPCACKSLFTRDSQSLHIIDANYLVSVLRPEYSPKGSTRQLVEESMMDSFQDFVYSLEDDNTISGFSEAMAWNEDQGVSSVDDPEPAEQFFYR
ncbi:hypothetical protein OS493_038662 [Desmophyllum pertusum]|uniref:HECT domain-containing protein n=1 Tax=Desmophyllum pertusum TaxID=174260 RepID=A0A9X0CJC4_9CNID|nr:hypothetical protein OS493_038662 [Desmophyllum pertusum]